LRELIVHQRETAQRNNEAKKQEIPLRSDSGVQLNPCLTEAFVVDYYLSMGIQPLE